jgi:hypothetical protein
VQKQNNNISIYDVEALHKKIIKPAFAIQNNFWAFINPNPTPAIAILPFLFPILYN